MPLTILYHDEIMLKDLFNRTTTHDSFNGKGEL